MGPCDKFNNINKNKNTSEKYNNKRQYQKSYVSSNSDNKVYIASGLYLVDVRDELLYNDYGDECVKNVRIKDDNDIVVSAKINGCVGNVLFDSGAQVSLINEKFINKHKHQFKKTPILPVNNTMVTTATGDSQIDVYKRQIYIYCNKTG